MEWYISGYCRAMDQARTVMVEEEDGQWDIGCDYIRCAHCDSCSACRQIKQLQEEYGA